MPFDQIGREDARLFGEPPHELGGRGVRPAQMWVRVDVQPADVSGSGSGVPIGPEWGDDPLVSRNPAGHGCLERRKTGIGAFGPRGSAKAAGDLLEILVCERVILLL